MIVRLDRALVPLLERRTSPLKHSYDPRNHTKEHEATQIKPAVSCGLVMFREISWIVILSKPFNLFDNDKLKFFGHLQ
jgi:hypothetical protein